MSKLPLVGTTIFSVMSKLALDHNAINLSQGFPNFSVDERLTQILKEISSEAVHQYMPMAGYGPLLQQIATTIECSYGRRVDVEKELLVTAGATQGIYTAIQAFVNVGEEVIILDPSYDCYEPAVILAGGKAIHVSLNTDFSVDWDHVESAFTDKTAMIVINNPHNPSGTVLKNSDIQRLEVILEKFPKVILLSDEVYEYITFEQPHISANTREKLKEKSVIVSSFGKTFHITGWKIGYLVAPENLMQEIKKVHQFLVFSVNSVAQVALAKYMEQVDVSQLGAFYQTKRDRFRNLMQGSKFKLLNSEGSYFQIASYKEISNESDIDFTKNLAMNHGVAAIPLSVFNSDQKDDKLIRFCFAKDDETILKAAEKLCEI